MLVSPLKPDGFAELVAGSQIPEFEIHGALDYSNCFGFCVFGKSRFGDDRGHGGIYRKAYSSKHNKPGTTLKPVRHIFVKMRSYAPTNPQTVPQQANRVKFSAARSAWQSLTDNEKAVYNRRATKQSRIGWRLFMSEYLNTH